MDDAVYGPVVMVCVTGFFGWFLIKGVRSGTMEWHYWGLGISGDRRKEPGKFWAATVLLAIPFCLGLIGMFAMIVWPHGIGS